ncbi:MAG: hypothetical protein ACP5G7_00690 [Anaerolineae bacterium]
MPHRLIVVGAGALGLMAAVRAAERHPWLRRISVGTIAEDQGRINPSSQRVSGAVGRSRAGDAVVSASGGVTCSEMGSCGDDLRMARDLEHGMSAPRSGPAPLAAVGPLPGELADLS